MKAKLDKAIITIAEREEAEQFGRESMEGIDISIIKCLVAGCLTEYHDGKSVFIEDVIKPEFKVCKNHYHLTVWCECLVLYVAEENHFAKVSFDMVDALSGKYCAFIIEYTETSYGTV